MAKGVYLKPYERDCVRVGYWIDLPAAQIASHIRRPVQTVYNIAQELRDEGTLTRLPFDADIIKGRLHDQDS